jgi:hypothetical protein
MHNPGPLTFHMTYLTWRRECVLSAIDRMIESSRAGGGPRSDGGIAFNAMVKELSHSLPVEEILAASTDLITAQRSKLSGPHLQVLETLEVCLPVNLERQELARRIRLDRALLEAHALRCTEDSLLVLEPARSTALQEVPIRELLDRHPCRGPRSRWSHAAFLALCEARLMQSRRTAMALEIAMEDPDSQPAIGSVILVVPQATAATLWFSPVVMTLPASARAAMATPAAVEQGPSCPLPPFCPLPLACALPPVCALPR